MLRSAVGLVLFLVLGNLAIYGASMWAKSRTSATPVVSVPGIDNLQAVDDKVWRGAAPTNQGYRALADEGVTTIIDLRAEDGLAADRELVTELGMKLVTIPIRDGQAPSAEKIDTMLRAVNDSPGTVFIHCGAGVGRTGTMVAAYAISKGESSSRGALVRNLAVGPPSLEQMAFVANLRVGSLERPSPVLTAASRVLDAPRRLWSRLG